MEMEPFNQEWEAHIKEVIKKRIKLLLEVLLLEILATLISKIHLSPLVINTVSRVSPIYKRKINSSLFINLQVFNI